MNWLKEKAIEWGILEDANTIKDELVLTGQKLVDSDWYVEAIKHHCAPCKRWFVNTRGKSMHDRHRHKNA